MKKILFFLLCCISLCSFSQNEDAWVFFKDKPNAASFLDNPITMVSQKAIERRNTQQISFDENDVPIHADYFNRLNNDATISILGKSKWLNAIHIQGTVTKINNLLSKYSFIKSIEYANKSLNASGKKNKKQVIENHHQKFSKFLTDMNYGSAENQITMLRGNVLHAKGLTGKGQTIAIIDAGFPNVNTLEAFKKIRDNNQILGGYNFADRNANFYTRHSHGTHVLSTIAGYIENEFVGTAPDANFYLFITEIAESESVLEETLWVEAAERADSLGVDIINTSLGYTTFDNPNHSHTYADMDGKTTFITRGAEIAASRGMLLVNSVGNSGSSSWKYMGAPADAPSIISVGAVNVSGNIASFSSFGPTADNRIKPEILAQGVNSAIINFTTGQVATSNGTSFSSPIIAGLIACLNQFENPLLKSGTIKNDETNFNELLKKAVFESAHNFLNPDNRLGYGIPNFEEALKKYFDSTASLEDSFLSSLKIMPNPIITNFKIDGLNGDVNEYEIQIFDILGKKVYYQSKLSSNAVDISNLEKGIYLLRVSKGNQQKTIKLVKE